MARKEILTNLIILIAAIVLCGSISACQTSKSSKQTPEIEVSPTSISLGELEEGKEYHRKVMLKNVGSKDLKIYEAHSSCGCTVPSLKKNDLKPDETTELAIMIDTAMKQGDVTKKVQISSNDPRHPITAVTLKMHVKNRHSASGGTGIAKIFTSEKCTSCHVDKGVGLAGKELYEADCAMCHGKDAKGAVGGALVYGDYNNETYAKHIKKVICYGSKTHQSMPGFLDKAGGPLLEEQIDSLVAYLKTLSEEQKAKSKKKESS